MALGDEPVGFPSMLSPYVGPLVGEMAGRPEGGAKERDLRS